MSNGGKHWNRLQVALMGQLSTTGECFTGHSADDLMADIICDCGDVDSARHQKCRRAIDAALAALEDRGWVQEIRREWSLTRVGYVRIPPLFENNGLVLPDIPMEWPFGRK